MIRDLKYLAAYTIPLLTALAIWHKGALSYLTLVVIFGIIPILELMTNNSQENLSAEESESKAKDFIFDLLLYINIPIVYSLLYYFLVTVSAETLTTFELIGLVLSMGIALGSNGINVAHELGHRSDSTHKAMAKTLLLPSMYMHFIIEHNLGHHKNVATIEDPATARKGENLYFFWMRSILMSYLDAWKIQSKLLSEQKKSFFSPSNEMGLFSIIQLLFCYTTFSIFGSFALFLFLLVALVSVLLLETINYVEHYGLLRKKNNNRYERVKPVHSWNSNHEIGRILLYELTRHSDHHFIANKKYQTLDHHDDSKQLPIGYPGSMLLSMVPPIWFKLMNHRIETA